MPDAKCDFEVTEEEGLWSHGHLGYEAWFSCTSNKNATSYL